MTTEDKIKKNNDEKEQAVKSEAKDEAKEEASKETIAETKAEDGKPAPAKDQPTETQPEAAAPDKKEEDKAADNPLMVTFSVEVKKEDIDRDFEEALHKYANEIKLPGFRKGKIPVDVIKSRFKEAITEEVVNKMVEAAVFKKIEDDKMKIISRPEIAELDYQEGKDVKADVKVEVFPTVQLPDFSTIEVEVPKDKMKIEEFDEAKQIDAILEGNRRQMPVVSRAIQDKDYVMYKHQAKILATKRMTPKKSDYFMMEENSPSDIIDLYKELLDKKIEDSLSFTRTYPEDYKKKAWAGKEIEHYVTIESIFEMVKPELDENFLKGMGFDDEESFKKKLKEEFEQHNEKHQEDVRMNFIIDKISDTITFPVPQAMVAQELSRMFQERQMPPIDTSDKDKLKEYMDKMKDDAERSIRFSFIMETIKEEHKLEVTSDDMEKEYKKIAEYNKATVKDVRKFYMQKENASQLKEALGRNKVMDFLKENVKVKEV